MKTISNPKEFAMEIAKERRIRFENNNLIAEHRQVRNLKGDRMHSLSYWFKEGVKWVKYSTITSPFIPDLIEDFLNEHKVICNG
jgi:hypothetical protein